MTIFFTTFASIAIGLLPFAIVLGVGMIVADALLKEGDTD